MSLDHPALRAAIVAAALCLLVLGGVDLGRRAVGPGPTFYECLNRAGDCHGLMFGLAGLDATGTVMDDAVSAVLPSGAVVYLQGWPAETLPYPAAGARLAVTGRYLGEARLEVEAAEVYPLDGVDRLAGILVTATWFVAFAFFVRRKLGEARQPHG